MLFHNIELTNEQKSVVEAAKKATSGSYSPYSHFKVGAALLLDNGQIITGSNQENAAYPSGLCAERTALFYAGANYPDVPVRKLAIISRQGDDFGTQICSPSRFCSALPTRSISSTASRVCSPSALALRVWSNPSLTLL